MRQRIASVYPRLGIRAPRTIEGLDHPKGVYDLTEGLIRRGYGDEDIRLMLGGNFKLTVGTIWREA